MSFLGEIKRRKVFQVAAVYGVVAWLILQVIDVINEPLQLPDWFATVSILLLAIGFPITLIMTWAFDLTPEGLVRDEGTPAPAREGNGRTMEYILIGLLALTLGFVAVENYVLDAGPDTGIAGNLPDTPFTNGDALSSESYAIVVNAVQNVFGDERSIENALKRIDAAINGDPSLSSAWIARALLIRQLDNYVTDEDQVQQNERAFDEAIANAELAGPEAADRLIGSAVANRDRGDRVAAVRDLQRVLSRYDDESLYEASLELGAVLLELGRPQSALTHLQRATALRPSDPGAAEQLAFAFAQLGRTDDALAEVARGVEQARVGLLQVPLYGIAYFVALGRGDWEAAVRIIDEGPAAGNYADMARLVSMEDRASALETLEPLVSEPPPNAGINQLAIVLAAMDEPELAATALRNMSNLDTFDARYLWLPNLSEARLTNAFKAVIRDVGLYDYWKQTGEWSEFCEAVGEDDFNCR